MFAVLWKRMTQRHGHGGEIGFRSSAGKGRNGISGQAELSRQPAQGMPLDLIAGGRGAPVG